MDTNKIIGIVGFVLVVGPFSFGLATTLMSGPEPERIIEPVVDTGPVEPDYVSYGLPLTVSLTKFNRSVAVGLSFMIDRGSPVTDEIWNNVNARDGRFDAVLTNAIAEAGAAASSPEDLRRVIPQMVRHAVNVQLGTEELPNPVREVLITSYAIQ